jgi:hypothetical protein
MDHQVVLYPNPSAHRVVLEGQDAANNPIDKESIKVLDLMGRQMPVDLCGEPDRLAWSVASWPRGTYIVQFVVGAERLPRALRLVVD